MRDGENVESFENSGMQEHEQQDEYMRDEDDEEAQEAPGGELDAEEASPKAAAAELSPEEEARAAAERRVRAHVRGLPIIRSLLVPYGVESVSADGKRVLDRLTELGACIGEYECRSCIGLVPLSFFTFVCRSLPSVSSASF